MSDDFTKLHDDISELVKKYEEKNILVKIQHDPESDMLKICGEKASVLQQAKFGLEEVIELAYSTAEHHPYWGLLYNGSQILKIILEKWNETLSEDDLKEINWYVDEIKNSTNNVSSHHHE